MIRYKHPLRSYYVYYCVVRENIHTSTEGTFTLDPPPPPLEFPWFSNLVGYPLERIFPSKTLLRYIIMQKIIVFAMKWEKNSFMYNYCV